MEQTSSELDFGPGPEPDDVGRVRDFRDGKRTGKFPRAGVLDESKEEGTGGLLGEPSNPEDVKLLVQERQGFGCRRKRSAAFLKGGKERSGRGVRVVAARGCGCGDWSNCCS